MITYNTWLKEWLNTYKKPFIKTYDSLKRNIRLHIPESLKKTFLSDITALDVQKALNNITLTRTRLFVFDIYHGSLSMAYKLGLTDKNIADLLIKPKHVRKVGSALSKIELQDFLLIINETHLKNFYLFLLYTGVRRSEGLNLLWSDVDFTNNKIHIRGTKTTLSDRYIPLFPDCKLLLLSIASKNDKVFNHYANFVTRTFKRLCPNHKLHDLRHTFATRCLECGINIKVVQRWLGHSRLDTTASIYSHCLDDFIQLESEKFKLL